MKTMCLLLSRSALLLVAVLLGSSGLAQSKFTVNGRLKIEGSDLSGARAVVYKNGEKDRTITANLGKFALDLDLNANYVISFEKDGYVAKKLSFNTKVPADASSGGFTPFEFAVSLFKQYDDINIVVFNQPVGVIRYENSLGDFDYDTDYTKSIQSQLQQVLAEVAKKQKEEEQQAGATAKAQAKAEAQARKDQEEKAAAEAKAQAEVARQAEAQAKAEKAKEVEARKEEQRVSAATKPTPAAVPVAAASKEAPEQSKVKVKPEPAPMVRNYAHAQARAHQDLRRTVEPVAVEEASRMAQARAVAREEEPVIAVVAEVTTVRDEELVVEPNKVMTVIRLEKAGVTTEYKKVIHKWGGTYYFRNGDACTQLQYEREALPEQLAGATPRGKMD